MTGDPRALARMVRKVLRKSGMDLDFEYPISYYLYFPTKNSAKKAAKLLESAGFYVKVERAALGDQWLTLATEKFVPALETISEHIALMQKLAKDFDGEYDGWEAELPVINRPSRSASTSVN